MNILSFHVSETELRVTFENGTMQKFALSPEQYQAIIDETTNPRKLYDEFVASTKTE